MVLGKNMVVITGTRHQDLAIGTRRRICRDWLGIPYVSYFDANLIGEVEREVKDWRSHSIREVTFHSYKEYFACIVKRKNQLKVPVFFLFL